MLPSAPRARRPRLALAGLLLTLTLALPGCGAGDKEAASLRLPLVSRPSLEREQEMTRQRLTLLHDRAERFAQDPAKSAAEKAEAYGELGRHYAALRQFETAAAAFENAALAVPTDRRWPYLRGASLQELAQPAAAAEAYEEALALAPQDAPTLLHLAEMRLELRQLDLAGPLFERASSLAPGCAAALWGLGRMASERGENGRAVELLERAAAADPSADAIRYSLGQAWRSLGDFGKAQQWLASSGQKRPRCADPLADEIGLLINATSLEVLRARVDAADFDSRADLAYAVRQLGTVVGAAEQMTALAASDPGLRSSPRAEARWRLIAGSLFASRGLDDKAAAELLRAVELDPQLAETHLRLGNLLARRGEMPSALLAYEAAARLLPGDRELALRRGKVLVNLGRFGDAAREFESAFAGGEGIVDAGLELGGVLGHQGKLDEALRVYGQVAAKVPQEKRAREGQATVLLLLGRVADARSSLQGSVADLPQASSLQHALARILAAGPAGVRDPARARQLATAAMEAEPTIDRVETLAMAAAAGGDFAFAAELEGKLIEDARRSGRGELATRLGRRLELYRAGRAFEARGPGDLIVSPPLLARAGAETRVP